MLLRFVSVYTWMWIVASALAVFIFESIPEWHFWQSSLKNLGHGCVFALATAVLLSIRQALMIRILLLFLLFALGALVERLQPYVGRTSSVEDVLNNGLGITFAFSIYLLFWERRWKFYALVSAVLSGVILVIPPASNIAAAYQQYQALPIVYDQHWGLNAPNVSLRYGAEPACALSNSVCSSATLDKGPYPGVSVTPVQSDWSDFESLEIHIQLLAQSDTVNVNLRIHDRWHINRFSDRFNRSYSLRPGQHRLFIPLSWLTDEDRNRPLDLEHIHQIMMFKLPQDSRYELKLIQIRLI